MIILRESHLIIYAGKGLSKPKKRGRGNDESEPCPCYDDIRDVLRQGTQRSGNAAMRSSGVAIGNFAPASAPVICAWIWSFTETFPSSIIAATSPAAFAIEQSGLWVSHPKHAPLIVFRDSSAFSAVTSFPVYFHFDIFVTRVSMRGINIYLSVSKIY